MLIDHIAPPGMKASYFSAQSLGWLGAAFNPMFTGLILTHLPHWSLFVILIVAIVAARLMIFRGSMPVHGSRILRWRGLTPADMRLSGCCRAVVGSLSWWLAARFSILHHRFTSAERHGAYEYEQHQSGQTITAAARWSREQLAEMAGLSVRTIQRIENGERPGLETLSALAAVFEVTVAEIGGEASREGAPGPQASLDLRIEEAKARVQQESRFFVRCRWRWWSACCWRCSTGTRTRSTTGPAGSP